MRIKDENKIDLIYQASLDLIIKQGIAGLTMAKIAKKAGIATGTLYIYFKNKEILIHNLYSRLKAEADARFLKGVDEKMDFRTALKTTWMNYLNHRIKYYKESVFLEQYYRSPYISEDTLALAESMKKPVHKLIEKGKQEGLVRNDCDTEMLFLAMLGFIRELADEHKAGVFKLDDKRLEKAFELNWKMLMK